MTNRQMAERTKGAVAADAGIYIGNGAWIFSNAGTPTDGTSGTGAGFAGPGSLVTDTTNAVLYINSNTKASPTWTIVGTQS